MEERHPKVRSTARAAGSLRHWKHSSSRQVSMAWQHTRAAPSAPVRESRTEETNLSCFPRGRFEVDTVGTAPLLHDLREQSLAICAWGAAIESPKRFSRHRKSSCHRLTRPPVVTIVQLAASCRSLRPCQKGFESVACGAPARWCSANFYPRAC